MSQHPPTSLVEIAHLTLNAPKTVAGYGRLRAVTDVDGALPAAIKAIYLAASALVRGYGDLARREMLRARDIGLSQEMANGAVAILCSVRGEGAAVRFNGIVEEIWGPATEAASEVNVTVAPGEAKRNFEAYFGSVPPSLQTLLDLAPVGADAYYLMRESTLSGTTLGKKNAELMLVAVLVSDYSEWSRVHIDGARKAGASEAEIAEAILCAVPASGLSAWVVGATAMNS